MCTKLYKKAHSTVILCHLYTTRPVLSSPDPVIFLKKNARIRINRKSTNLKFEKKKKERQNHGLSVQK